MKLNDALANYAVDAKRLTSNEKRQARVGHNLSVYMGKRFGSIVPCHQTLHTANPGACVLSHKIFAVKRCSCCRCSARRLFCSSGCYASKACSRHRSSRYASFHSRSKRDPSSPLHSTTTALISVSCAACLFHLS